MTKEQKFEARLTEMGLLNEWNKQGRCGRVATTDANGNIILFVHEDETDGYSEIHYPPFEELRNKYGFIKNCILEWKGYDAMFECKLDAWLGGVEDSPCPLDPVDAYFPASSFQTFYEDFEDDPDGIMDTTNAHNPDLVAQVNEKWNKFNSFFRPILCALYERDIDEITDADSFHIPAWEQWEEYKEGCDSGDWRAYNAKALRFLKREWEAYAENYLMHIADDQDLEVIIQFVRFDVCEGTGRDRISR